MNQPRTCLSEPCERPQKLIKDLIMNNSTMAFTLSEKLTRLEAALMPVPPSNDKLPSSGDTMQGVLTYENIMLQTAMETLDRIINEIG